MSDVELTVSAGQKHPSAGRLIATLAIAALLAGAALSIAFQATKPVIDANKARELRLGVLKVVPGSTQLREVVIEGRTIFAAYDETGSFMGWAISGDTPGFQDTIEVLYGFDPAKRLVTGMHVLTSRETPGLGDKIYKDEDFVANFGALAVDPRIVVVKDGRDADNEVDAITGATISSQAVVRIINEANERWLPLLPAEPPPIAEDE